MTAGAVLSSERACGHGVPDRRVVPTSSAQSHLTEASSGRRRASASGADHRRTHAVQDSLSPHNRLVHRGFVSNLATLPSHLGVRSSEAAAVPGEPGRSLPSTRMPSPKVGVRQRGRVVRGRTRRHTIAMLEHRKPAPERKALTRHMEAVFSRPEPGRPTRGVETSLDLSDACSASSPDSGRAPRTGEKWCSRRAN